MVTLRPCLSPGLPFSISLFYIMVWPSFKTATALNFVQPKRPAEEQKDGVAEWDENAFANISLAPIRGHRAALKQPCLLQGCPAIKLRRSRGLGEAKGHARYVWPGHCHDKRAQTCSWDGRWVATSSITADAGELPDAMVTGL